MKQTTKAIVLGLRKHTDKMSVLHVFSQAEGRMTLQVYGANSKHKVRAAYQPLSVVEITYDAHTNRSMPVISTIDPIYLPEQVYQDIRKQSIALFVTEVLMLTFTHPMQDLPAYDFLDNFVHELNGTSAPENMHISFMVSLAEHLGIGAPEVVVAHSREQRQEQLHQLCDYYLTHIESFRMPKSLDILIEIFD